MTLTVISLEGIRIEDETSQVSVQISQILFNHLVITIDTVTYKLHPWVCNLNFGKGSFFFQNWEIKMPSKTMQYISISTSYPIYFF